uniref:RING-type domain-containing protein n=1 Tax=Hanusia phi TaxID=3032 RepID=A0A7S0HAD0_9CRYP
MTIQDDNAAQALIQLFSGEGLKTTNGSKACGGKQIGNTLSDAALQLSVRRGGRKRKPSSRLDAFRSSDHEVSPCAKESRVKRCKIDEAPMFERKRKNETLGTGTRFAEKRSCATDCESDNSSTHAKKGNAQEQKNLSRRASPISQASTPVVSPMPSPVESASSNKYCHFCQHVKVKRSTSMLSCSQCDRRYCEYCLRVHLCEIWERNESWSCPRCRCKCCCNSVSCTKLHRHCKAYRYRLLRAKQAELRAAASPREATVHHGKRCEAADQLPGQDPRGWMELQAVVSSALAESAKKTHHAHFEGVEVKDPKFDAGSESKGEAATREQRSGNSLSMLLCSDDSPNRLSSDSKCELHLHKFTFPSDLTVSDCVTTKHTISGLLTV